MPTDLKRMIARITPDVISLRRDLHTHPELSFHEQRTAQVLAKHLESLGIDVQTGVGRTGVVGLLKGGAKGKTVAIRADIDALPVTETADRVYRSKNAGVMHACGHDGHAAIVAGAAYVLSKIAPELKGQVKFLFQPAEETANGAMAMIKDGAMKNPKPDAMVSIHLWNYLPVGTVGLRGGALWASVDDLRITIKGRGGHGGLPHQTIDPMPTAAQVVVALQQIVSREVSPFQPVVLTIGSIKGGTAYNIIPEQVTMNGTLRTYDMKLRDHLIGRIETVLKGICHAMRCEYEFEARFCCPPLINDPKLTEFVRGVCTKAFGAKRVVTVDQATTGDDVAYFFDHAPGCYIMVGSGNAKKGFDKPHHHPQFDFDEDALPVGVEALVRSTVEYLKRG